MPAVSHCWPRLLQETHQQLHVCLFHSPVGSLWYSFSLGPFSHKILFVPPKNGVFLSPSPTIKPHCPSKLDSLGIPSPFARFLVWEACCEVQKLYSSERTSLVLSFSNLWVVQLLGTLFEFIMILSLLPSLCSLSFDFSYVVLFFFGGF